MKKFFLGLALTLTFLVIRTTSVFGQLPQPYVIENFTSSITINQDASLVVTETIKVLFNENRHGIYRDIPVVYRAGGKTINSKLSVLSVRDENGKSYKYETSRSGDNTEIKIGDTDVLVNGRKVYTITYRVRNIIQRYEEHDELYWNVIGSAWDTEILKAEAEVKSGFAEVTNIRCFSGYVGTSEAKCDTASHEKKSASFNSNTSLGEGRDMTIVVGLDKNNQLNFSRSASDLISDYWGYPVSILPFLLILFFWFRKGRDVRFKEGSIYYESDPPVGEASKNDTEVLPIFGKREYLPMVYSPIQGLTPSEVGTLVDEKVDIHDVVAEITELGRLGFLKIEKLVKKLALDDYLIKKVEKDDVGLREFQKYLMEALFSFGEVKNQVKLSELKRKFYKKLDSFKDKLYKEVHEVGYFSQRPDRVRATWIAIASVLYVAVFIFIINFWQFSYDFWPLAILVVSAPVAFILAFNMPRKTPKGYSLFRQIKGLAFYLDKGKWREEIAEKHLFLEEMLPLAISLGVVKKLAKDMEELGVEPPSYFDAHGAAWASSFSGFNTDVSSAMVLGSSSSGSWSGGSGFSGGSSGGGFGGGGGGSW